MSVAVDWTRTPAATFGPSLFGGLNIFFFRIFVVFAEVAGQTVTHGAHEGAGTVHTLVVVFFEHFLFLGVDGAAQRGLNEQ